MYVYRLNRLLAALLVLVAGLLVTSPTRAQGETVVVEAAEGNVFRPATITINVGDTVTWRNTDVVPHTSTSDDQVWDSGNLGSGEEFSFTFEQAGTFPYFCAYHQGMEGTVIVQQAQQEAEPTAAVEPTETTQAEPTAAAEPTEATQAEPTAAAEPTAEMPEHTPNTGAGGTTGGGIGTVLAVLLAGVLLLTAGGLRARIARSR